MTKKVWWFLLINNLIILFLFVRKMKMDGDLTVGLDLSFSDWQVHVPSSQIIVGALPFVFSMGFIIYKTATYQEPTDLSPEILDRESPTQNIEEFFK